MKACVSICGIKPNQRRGLGCRFFQGSISLLISAVKLYKHYKNNEMKKVTAREALREPRFLSGSALNSADLMKVVQIRSKM